MATWSKLFSNFAWKNRPDTSTPLGQALLNRLNTALNGIDDRVITLNSQMVSIDEIQGVFTDVRLIKNTGQFVFTLLDGTEKIIDTALEKISINVSFDQATQMMVLEKEDGSKEYVDLSAFTTQYEFSSSPTIQQTVTDGKVRADIKPNSITDQMLQTNYLADITTQANTALSASQSALESQSLAEQSAEDAKEQADRAKAEADRAEAVVGFTVDTELSTSSTNPIANKAVAEEFGKYFKKSGGTVNGTVSVKGILAVGDPNLSEGVQDILRNANRTLKNELGANGDYALWDSTNSCYIIKSTRDGTHTFYGTASGNLPFKGGIVGNGDSNFPLGVKGSSYGLTRYLNKDNAELGALGMYGVDKPSFVTADKTKAYDLLHTGNKPTGTYTGNGSATERTVATGGTGKVLFVYNSNGFAFVSAVGAMVFYRDGTSPRYFDSSATYWTEIAGLHLLTTDKMLNGNGVSTVYQVL